MSASDLKYPSQSVYLDVMFVVVMIHHANANASMLKSLELSGEWR